LRIKGENKLRFNEIAVISYGNERKDGMHIFSVDKLVFNAVRAYKAGEYQTAEVALNQALKSDQKDFAANLWKVRTLVMLGRYTEGIRAVDAYSNKKLHTKLAELLLKWKAFCLTKVQSNEAEEKDLIQMNQETDEMLEKYQHKRDFRLWGYYCCSWTVFDYRVSGRTISYVKFNTVRSRNCNICICCCLLL